MDDLATVRVLIVDDHEPTRRILSAMLLGAGIRRIKQAENGEDALALVRTWSPDVAFFDYHMGEMDGVGLTKAVRLMKHGADRFLPIIMMTAHSDEVRMRNARDAGVSEIIVKPATTSIVLDRLSRVIFKPRPFVETPDYFGPDRRRHADADDDGPRRRSTDAAAPIAEPDRLED